MKNSCILLSIFLISVLSADQSYAIEWKDAWQTPDQQGEALLQQEQPEEASEIFEDTEWKAAALYRAKKYKESAEALDGMEQVDAWYNRGNALAKKGDLQAAIEAYEHALEMDDTHEDAIFNLALLRKALKKQQSEQQKSSDQNESGEQDKSEQQSDEQNQDDQSDQSAEQDKSEQQSDEQNQSGDQPGQQDDSDEQASDAQQSGQQQADEQEKPDNKNESGEQDESEQQSDEKSGEDQGDQFADQNPEQPKQASEDDSKQNKSATEEEDTTTGVDDEEGAMKKREENYAREQWLRRIPDNPGGLLRRKFSHQYKQREQLPKSGEGQAW